MMKAFMRLPSFLIIGACKAGTTTLYDDLARHPDSAMPSDKEPDILHRASGDPAEARRLWDAHFSGMPIRAIRGEASTYYTMLQDFGEVASLARAALGPDLRLVYLMRDPVTRIESHLAHDYSVGRLPSDDFDRHALEEPRFVDWSNYALQLRPWIAAFGREALMPLVFEEFIRDRNSVAARVASFVGLDPVRLPECTGVSNVRGTQRAPRSSLLSQIQRSALYRRGLRPLLPARLHGALREGMTSARHVPKITLAPATVAEVRSRLCNLEDELRALDIPVGPWFAADA